MPILMVGESEGLTAEIYAPIATALAPVFKQSPGFILHMAHATETGLRIVEVWQTKEDSDRFFAKNVAPNLPPGIRPKRRTQPLESLITLLPG